MIENKKKHPNIKRVSLQDIAEVCGVSKMSVSLALRNLPGISDETSKRIKLMAEEMGYNPAFQDAARKLASRKGGENIINHVIAVVMPPNFCDSRYVLNAFEGMISVAADAGYALVTTYYNFRSLEEHLRKPIDPLPRIFAAGGVDGLLVVDISKDIAITINYLQQNSAFNHEPVVSLFNEHTGYSSVLIDDYSGMSELMNHLLEAGHQYFLRFTPLEQENVRFERDLAIEQALTAAGLPLDKHLFSLPIPQAWITGQTAINSATEEHQQHYFQASELLLQFLRLHPQITAVVAFNDVNAAIVHDVLIGDGFSLPGDISITGFDNVNIPLHSWANNELTTINSPLYLAGREAAKLLISLIENDSADIQTISLPTKLVIRNSVAPPACRKIPIVQETATPFRSKE